VGSTQRRDLSLSQGISLQDLVDRGRGRSDSPKVDVETLEDDAKRRAA
jgi:hypothetical protein